MLAGGPLYYFLYQTLVLNGVLIASVMMQNAAARRIAAKIAV
jgi:hypothetical protein